MIADVKLEAALSDEEDVVRLAVETGEVGASQYVCFGAPGLNSLSRDDLIRSASRLNNGEGVVSSLLVAGKVAHDGARSYDGEGTALIGL